MAEAIAEYAINSSAQLDGADKTEIILDCLGSAAGIGGLPFAIDCWRMAGLSKAAAKAAAKTLASRCIPYVGAALFAGQFALCLHNHLDRADKADNENLL